MSRRAVALAVAVVAAIAAAFLVGKSVGGKRGQPRITVVTRPSGPSAVDSGKSVLPPDITSVPVIREHSESGPETRGAGGRSSRTERPPVPRSAPPPSGAPLEESAAAPAHVAARVLDFQTDPPDSSGDVWFHGQAMNGSPTETQSVEVVATAYDQDGGVVGTSTTYVYPSPLPPMARGTFRSYVSSRGVPIAKVEVQAIEK